MPNGPFIPRYQPIDYSGLARAAAAPAAGLLGGIQAGMEVTEQLGEMQARRQEREAETRRQAIAMQAAAGDPTAQEQLLGLDPEAAYRMQQVQFAREEAAEKQRQREEERDRREMGKISNYLVGAKKEDGKRALKRFFTRVNQEWESEDDPTPEDFGLTSIDDIDAMTPDEAFAAAQRIGNRLQRESMTPAEFAKLELERRKVRVAEEKAKAVTPTKAASQIGKIQEDVNNGFIDPTTGAQAIDNILTKAKGKVSASKEERDRGQYIRLSIMKDQGKKLSQSQEKLLTILDREYGEQLPTVNVMMSEIIGKVKDGVPLTKEEVATYQLARDPMQLMLAQALGAPITEMPEGITEEPAAPETPAPEAPAPAPAEAEVLRRRTADGRTAVFDAAAKQFLRYE